MHLKLTKPKCGIPGHYNKLFSTWLWANGIYIGVPGIDFETNYNDFYNFWELNLYEIEGDKKPKGHWDETITYLKKLYGKVEVSHDTWRWEKYGKLQECAGCGALIRVKAHLKHNRCVKGVKIRVYQNSYKVKHNGAQQVLSSTKRRD